MTHLGLRIAAALCVAGALAEPHRALAQAPAEIVERAIAAHGGRDALAAATSIVWRAPVRLGAAAGTSTRSFKWPDKLRVELTVALRVGDDEARVDIVRLYDGRSAWTKEQGGFRQDPAQAAALGQAARRTLHILLRSGQPGVSLEPAGADSVVMRENGSATTLSFDADTGLLTGLAYSYAAGDAHDAMENKVEFSDFRAVGALRMPYRLVQFQNGKKLGEVSYSSINIGDELPDSLFAPP